MKNTIALITALFLALLLTSCLQNKEEFAESSNTPTESSRMEAHESLLPQEPKNIEEIKRDYNETVLQNENILAQPKGYSENERPHYIAAPDGEILKTFVCEDLYVFSANKNLLVVRMTDNSSYFIDTDGERIDSAIWDALHYWEDAPWEYTAAIGQRGDEFYALDSMACVLMQISTEPEIIDEYAEGVQLVKAFNCDNYYYGLMKNGEYILRPTFWNAPIIKNGLIITDNNAHDILSSESFIYDFSGKLLKQAYGSFRAHEDFDYIIAFERYDEYSVEGEYSILDYSLKTLYTAEKGGYIGFDYISAFSNDINPYRVILDGESVHLETLIDGIVYPPVTIRDYADAKDITPDKLSVIRTPYLIGNTGRQYPVTDELKSLVKEKLLEYLALAEITFEEEKFSYLADEGTFYAKYVDEVTVLAYCDSLLVKTDGKANDLLSNPTVEKLCEMTFKNNEKLRIVETRNEGTLYGDAIVFTIYEEKETVDETMLALAEKYISVFTDGQNIKSVQATDRSNEKVFPNYTFNAVSYDEAVEELRKGNFKTPPFSLIEFDHKKANIEATEFEYILITDCECEQCYDVGYYIPCYSFYVRDSDSPEYVGNVLVPAISIDELNEYLASVSQPQVNHFWTEE